MYFFSVYDSTGLSSVGSALEVCMMGDSCNVGAAEAVVDWTSAPKHNTMTSDLAGGRKHKKLTGPVDMCGGECNDEDND